MLNFINYFIQIYSVKQLISTFKRSIIYYLKWEEKKFQLSNQFQVAS